MADPNTRQGKRTPVTLKIKFKSETLEQFIERYAVDVSQGGIFIRTKEPLAVGTQMRFEFQLRDASPLIGGEGTVVWTRENDPSRPAIAPGMGVRFDRLADGSQAVLERILAEKAKQAPQRGSHESSRPPLFTDTPTRVAPAPIKEALLNDSQPRRGDFNDQHTPLPKPVPFHSDAEDYPEEAFEEATKVRDLDELIAQTAEPATVATPRPPEVVDEVTHQRPPPRADSTLADAPPADLPATQDPSEPADPGSTSPGFASGRGSQPSLSDRDSAPGLPNPPSIEGFAAAKPPRLLDTSPSPRSDADPMEKLAKTKLGLSPPPVNAAPGAVNPAAAPRTPQPTPPSPSIKDAPTRPSGMGAVATEPTSPVKRPAKKSSNAAAIVILVLVLLAAGAAGVWFFVLRDKVVEDNRQPIASTGSDASAGSGSGTAMAPPDAPPVPKELVETEIKSVPENAKIEVVGTDQWGPSPLKAKLEKDKAYTLRISAPGFTTHEQEITGGQEGVEATLAPKPRVVEVKSDPEGALIAVDGKWLGKITPSTIELTKAQAEKKKIRIMLRKDGRRLVEKSVSRSDFVEQDAKMVASLDVRLPQRRPPPIRTNNPAGSGSGSGSATGSDAGAGSAAGSGAAGSGATPPGGTGGGSAGSGSATQPPPPPPAGGGSATTGGGTTGGAKPGGAKPGGTGGTTTGGTTTGAAEEPEPEFVKPES